MANSSGTGAPIAFQNVTVRYPHSERDAIADITLAIPAGEFVVLLGPSGCGKSTLIRTVNRLIEPQHGHVSIDGTDVSTMEPTALRRSIGYVIQAVGLFAHMSVEQNVSVVPSLLGWDRARIDARTDELLTLVELSPARYRKRFPRELSGGEQQRVGVARAIAAQPSVLLMDEPFGAVDAIVRTALQDETKRIARVLQTTILFVTHDVDEALRLADRIVIMQDGRLVQYGTPLEILTAPKTPYVTKLLDTKDVIRRLQLLRTEAAMQPGLPSEATAKTIDANATLREALNDFLQGDARLTVTRQGAAIGSLTFEDVQRVLHMAP